MAGNPVRPAHRNDDIDLLQVLDKLVLFTRRSGKLVGICVLSGLLVATLLYQLLPRQYKSTMLLHSTLLSNTEEINIIDNWNALLKTGEYEVLARYFNCNTSMVKKLVSITAAEIQKLYVPNSPNGFLITVTVKDNSILDSLGRGIIYGFESNDYMRARLDTRRATLLTIIDKVKAEIVKLDDTRQHIQEMIRRNDRAPAAVIFDVSTLNGQLIGLNEKLLAYQDELKFTTAVQVYQPFARFRKPVFPKLISLLLLGFAAGLACGYALALLTALRRRYPAREQQDLIHRPFYAETHRQ